MFEYLLLEFYRRPILVCAVNVFVTIVVPLLLHIFVVIEI
jgi:hypothetical protein